MLFGSDSSTALPLSIKINRILTLPRTLEEMKQDILYNNVNKILNIK